LGGRSVGTSGHGVNGIIVVGLSGVITLAAATLTADGLSGDVPVDYSLISTSTPPAPPPIPLAPNDRGYVRVETKSGSTRCSIAAELVAGQTSADNGPRRPDGRRFPLGRRRSRCARGPCHAAVSDLHRTGLDDQRHPRSNHLHQRPHRPRHVRRRSKRGAVLMRKSVGIPDSTTSKRTW
jgi:hypothetical protein